MGVTSSCKQDPPKYFDRPGGYISFDMDIPKELLKNAKPHPSSIAKEGTVGHFKLVHHQILQVRLLLFCIADAISLS